MQSGLITRHSDLFSAKRILNKVANRNVCVERQTLAHEGKTTHDHCSKAMSLPVESEEVLRGALRLAVSRAGIIHGRAAAPVFRNRLEIRWLRPVDAAGADEQESTSSCCYREIENIRRALHNLLKAAQRGEAGHKCGISRRMQHMSKRLTHGREVRFWISPLRKVSPRQE